MASNKQDVDAAPLDELGHFSHKFSITMELDKHPAMMAMAAAAVVLIILYLFSHAKSSGAISPTPAVPADTATQPFLTQPIPVNVTVTGGTGTGTGTGGTGGGTGGGNNPGSTFKGPTGVLHYVALGTETLSQIAAKFQTGTWNSIYGIPANQKLFGKMDSTHAASYKPASGLVITLPGSAKVS